MNIEHGCTPEELARAGHEALLLDALYMLREQHDPDAGPRVAIIEEQASDDFRLAQNVLDLVAYRRRRAVPVDHERPAPLCRFVSPAEAGAVVLAKRPRAAALRGYQRLAEETAERRAEPGTLAALVIRSDGSAGLYGVSLERVRKAEPRKPFDYHGMIVEQTRSKLGALYQPTFAALDLVAAIRVPEDDGECERIVSECLPYPSELRPRNALVEQLIKRGSSEVAADLAARRAPGMLDVVVFDYDEADLRSVVIEEIQREKRAHVIWQLGATLAALRGGGHGVFDLPEGAQVRPTIRCHRCAICAAWTQALFDAGMFRGGPENIAADAKTAPLAAAAGGSPICVPCLEDVAVARAALEADGYPVVHEELVAVANPGAVVEWYVERYRKPHQPLAQPLGSIVPARDEPDSKPPPLN